MGTMHSHAAKLLQDHFGYGNHDVLDENEEVAFILRYGWDLGPGDSAGRENMRYGDYYLSFLESQWVVSDELLDLEEVGRSGSPEFAEEVERYWGCSTGASF